MTNRPNFTLTQRGDALHLRFLSSRVLTVLGLLLITAVLLTPVTVLSLLKLNGLFLSMTWGASMGIVLPFWFVFVPKLARVDVTIEPDVVRMQRTWFRVPLGAPEIYPRNAITDLGAYFGGGHGRVGRTCTLSLWHNGRTIELESAFPSVAVYRLRQQLALHGVEFPVTLEEPEFEMQPGGRIR